MLNCLLLSPVSQKNISEIETIFIETVVGQREILKGHIELAAALKDHSLIRLVSGTKEFKFRLGTGNYFHFKKNSGCVLAKQFVQEELENISKT